MRLLSEQEQKLRGQWEAKLHAVVFGRRRGFAAEVWRSVRKKSDISTVI